MLHWTGLTGPEAAETTVGLRVVKNATKNKAPIANVKRLRTCFIFRLLCIFQFAPRGHFS